LKKDLSFKAKDFQGQTEASLHFFKTLKFSNRKYPEVKMNGEKERIERAAERAFDLLNSDKRRA